MEFHTVVVGAGPAGLFAAARASAAGRVLLVDSGADLGGRLAARRRGGDQHTTITSGFGGAGLFSDGKLCLSHRIGSTVSHRFPTAEVNGRQRMIDEAIRGGRPAPLAGVDVAAAKELAGLAASAGMEYVHYPVRHVGTDQLPSMLSDVRDQLGDQVQVNCRTSCLDVRPIHCHGAQRWMVELDGGHARWRIAAANVVLAPGKLGASWLADLGERLGLRREPPRPKLGFRLEGPRDFLDPLLAVADDPKLIWRAANGAEARTHCVCPGGDVVAAAYEDLVLVGGHSASDRAQDRSNCALIAAPGTSTPVTDLQARDVVPHQSPIRNPARRATPGRFPR